jgi:hypothetical protein
MPDVSLALIWLAKAFGPAIAKEVGKRTFQKLSPLIDQVRKAALNKTATELEWDFPSGNFVEMNFQFDAVEVKAELQKLLSGQGIPDQNVLKKHMVSEITEKWPKLASKADVIVETFLKHFEQECLGKPELSGLTLASLIKTENAATRELVESTRDLLSRKLDKIDTTTATSAKTDQIFISALKTEMKSQFSELKLYNQQLTEQLVQTISQRFPMQTASDGSTKDDEEIDKYLHGEIDGYRDMIKAGRPRTALDLLDKLRLRCWEKASSRVRFRVLTNIGAAKLQLGDDAEAAFDFLVAIQYDPTNRIGMANVALAYIITERDKEALKAAEAALVQDPTNADAACYLIQAHHGNPSATDPSKLVSAELLDTPQVRLGIISFFRRRHHPDWRKAAIDAASRFPGEKEINRAAAARQHIAAALVPAWRKESN